MAYSAGQERINEWKNNIKIMFGGVGERVSNILEKTKRYGVMAIGAPESIKYTKEVLESKSQEIQDKVEKAISEFTDKMRNGIEQRKESFIQSIEDFKSKIDSLKEDTLGRASDLVSEAAIAGLDWGSKVEDVLQKIYEIPAMIDSTKAEVQQYVAVFQQIKFNMASMDLEKRVDILGQSYFEMELQPIIDARDSARKRSDELRQMSRNRIISSKRKFGNLKAIAYGLKVYKKVA